MSTAFGQDYSKDPDGESGNPFSAEQYLGGSGNLVMSVAETARDLVGPGSLLLGVMTPSASYSSIAWR